MPSQSMPPEEFFQAAFFIGMLVVEQNIPCTAYPAA
jgi:hypothetical protein